MLGSKREKVKIAVVCNHLKKKLYSDDDGHFGAESFGCPSYKH